jgi:lipoteichoic acid synthase
MKEKLIWVMFAMAVIFAKAFAYYKFMGVGIHKFMFAGVSTITVLWLFALFVRINTKKSTHIFLGVYTLISLIMLIDTIYYKQFNMFTSVNLFKMAGKLGDVSNSVKQILDIKFLIFAIDIPLIFLAINRIRKAEIHKVRINNIVLAAMTILVFSAALLSKEVAYAESINKIEFFNYHANDIYKNWISSKHSSYSEAELENHESVKSHADDKLWGVAKGRNLIVLQIESYQNFLLNRKYDGQEITPFLNSLVKDNSLYFDKYYDQVGYGNTSDAEFTTNNSLFGTLNGSTYDLYPRTIYDGLPWQLRDNGYSTISFHGYKGDFWNRNIAHPYQGFENFVSMEDFKPGETIGMGLSDVEVYKQSMGYLKQLKSPFYSFFITLSNHHPYVLPKKYQEIKLKDEDKNTLFGNYIVSARYTDTALKQLFDMLKKEGLYDNSVIAMYGDHHGLVVTDTASRNAMTKFLGKEYDLDEMAHIPMIIHIPGLGYSKTMDIAGGQVDFMPTIMNILGVQNKNPYVLGQDLVNAKSGFVPMLMYTGKGSFIKDDKVFMIKTDGVFENARSWDPATGKSIPLESCKGDYEKALIRFDKSDHIKEYNMITRQK